MEIYRLPRYRGNRWASCFYDCLETIMRYENIYSPCIYLGMLDFEFTVDEYEIIYGSLNFINWIDTSISLFAPIKIEYSNDFKKITENQYCIIHLNAYLWKFDESYHRKMTSHSSIFLNKTKNGLYKIIDSYNDKFYYCNMEDLQSAYLGHYYLQELNSYKKSFQELRLLFCDRLSDFVDSLRRLSKYNREINFNESSDITKLYNLAQQFADRLELFIAPILFFYKTFKTSHFYSKYIKIILRWQNVRKVWFKKLDLLEYENRKRIFLEVFDIIDSMEILFDQLSKHFSTEEIL